MFQIDTPPRRISEPKIQAAFCFLAIALVSLSTFSLAQMDKTAVSVLLLRNVKLSFDQRTGGGFA